MSASTKSLDSLGLGELPANENLRDQNEMQNKLGLESKCEDYSKSLKFPSQSTSGPPKNHTVEFFRLRRRYPNVSTKKWAEVIGVSLSTLGLWRKKYPHLANQPAIDDVIDNADQIKVLTKDDQWKTVSREELFINKVSRKRSTESTETNPPVNLIQDEIQTESPKKLRFERSLSAIVENTNSTLIGDETFEEEPILIDDLEELDMDDTNENNQSINTTTDSIQSDHESSNTDKSTKQERRKRVRCELSFCYAVVQLLVDYPQILIIHLANAVNVPRTSLSQWKSKLAVNLTKSSNIDESDNPIVTVPQMDGTNKLVPLKTLIKSEKKLMTHNRGHMIDQSFDQFDSVKAQFIRPRQFVLTK